jgi:hypothetical protein
MLVDRDRFGRQLGGGGDGDGIYRHCGIFVLCMRFRLALYNDERDETDN